MLKYLFNIKESEKDRGAKARWDSENTKHQNGRHKHYYVENYGTCIWTGHSNYKNGWKRKNNPLLVTKNILIIKTLKKEGGWKKN